jgi:hypothetical protein
MPLTMFVMGTCRYCDGHTIVSGRVNRMAESSPGMAPFFFHYTLEMALVVAMTTV